MSPGPHHVSDADTARTRRTYDFTWQRVSRQETEQGWEKDSYAYDALIPRNLLSGAGKLGLDAGCGGGADLVRTASGGSELVGLDLSEGVRVAAARARHLPSVRVVQGDLRRPPFADRSFDFIYSFGALHHLPDPADGFKQLSRLLKPGGVLITYLYEDFGDRSRVERLMLGLIRGIRRVTSHLQPRALYALCWLFTPMIWVLCSVPAWVLRRAGSPLAERLPFRHTLRWPVIASDLFDRFAPPVEWRFSREGVLRLYEAAGLQRATIRRYRGWVSWAFAPGGGSTVQHGETHEAAARLAD